MTDATLQGYVSPCSLTMHEAMSYTPMRDGSGVRISLHNRLVLKTAYALLWPLLLHFTVALILHKDTLASVCRLSISAAPPSIAALRASVRRPDLACAAS